MKLPNLNDVDVSKKAAMAIAGAYFVRDIMEFQMAALVAGLICFGIAAQLVIDVVKILKGVKEDERKI